MYLDNFDGWIIVVRVEDGEPIGYYPFTASSSPEIEGLGIGVGVIGITIPIVSQDMKSKVADDFRDNFYAASEAAIDSMTLK